MAYIMVVKLLVILGYGAYVENNLQLYITSPSQLGDNLWEIVSARQVFSVSLIGTGKYVVYPN